MKNTKHEALNPKQARSTKSQIRNVWNFVFIISDLSFDFAQDGVLVEPCTRVQSSVKIWKLSGV